MDFAALAADWLKFLRGKRSQRGFSQYLGYRSNIAYRWESGVCFPSGAEAFAIAQRSKALRVRPALQAFLAAPSEQRLPNDLSTREGIAELLRVLRGDTRVVELAKRSGLSRFSIARWLAAEAEPRLPELLALIEAMTFRCLDFLSYFAPLERLPSVADAWRDLQAARKAAYDVPWSHAVLRALELADYEGLVRHRSGWIAKRLGISRAEERRCLDVLSAAGQIRMVEGRFRIDQSQTIDTRSNRALARKLKADWAKVALSRLEQGVPGTFSYNLMSISLADLERLKAIHSAYFREMQALVADSTPSECVVLFNTELFALDAHALEGARQPAQATNAPSLRNRR